MPTPEVIEKLRQLRTELATTPDAPGVQSLREDLDAVLVEPSHAQGYGGLKERLVAAYVGFQQVHPKLAASIEGVTSELTAAGL
jgi:hypothetical protein